MPTRRPLTDEDVTSRRLAIGEALREARIHAGLSQVRLGELVGRDHKTIHRWETARSEPRLSDLIRLQHALNVQSDELLPPDGAVGDAEPRPPH